MKIIGLHAENIKKLKVVEIVPTEGDPLVQITGDNGAGKTSVLDAIFWALAGGSAVQNKPIRDGEQKGLIELDLGDFKVVRTFTAQEGGDYTTALKVTTTDGAKYPKPQDVIDGLVGKFAFDPLAFLRSKPQEQVAALQGMASDFDFPASERLEKTAFASRTDVNRDIKRLEAELEAKKRGLPEVVPEPVDVAALTNEMRKAQEANAGIRQRARDRENLLVKQNQLRDALAGYRAKVAEFEGLLDASVAELEGFGPTETEIDTTETMGLINDAAAINDIVRRFTEADEIQSRLVETTKKADALTDEIAAERKAQQHAIAKAKIPVPGLALTEGVVTLDGIPFDQASDAQQLRASIGLAMAMNPKLRVIRVRDGSLLSNTGMATLAEMATAQDFQIWIERVDTSGETGFYMEDGAVKGQMVEPKIKPKAEGKPDEQEDPGPAKPAGTAAERLKPSTASTDLFGDL